MSGEVLEVEVLPSTAEGFAGQIQVLQAKSVETLIEIGRVFLSAKATLPHGEFGKVAELCGVSSDTVQRYMRVAKNEALSNAAHARLLPPAVTTLDALAAWPEDELKAALAEGVVRPEMTRDEVRELYNRRTRTEVETPLFLTDEAKVEARAAIDAGRVHANQLVRETAKRVRGMALSDEGLPDAAHAVRAAKWLCSQWTSESHPKPVQELARQQLVALAAGTVGPADATDLVRKEIAAHRPGTPEFRMRQESEPLPAAAAEPAGTSPHGVPATDQGPSLSTVGPGGSDDEAPHGAGAAADEDTPPVPSSSSLQGADVEPVVGDDDASVVVEGSADGAGPSISLEAFWSQLTEVQRDALELVVLENADNKAARYSNKTSERDGDVLATVYHQTADVLLDFELLAFVADTMRTELEATERGIELVLTFGKIAAGEGLGSASGTSPVACKICDGAYELDDAGLCQGCAEGVAVDADTAAVFDPALDVADDVLAWDDLDDAAKWARLEEPERRMLIEAMWAADADEPPYGLDDGNLVQNELIGIGLLEEVELEGEWMAAVLTAEGMRLVRAFGTVEACPQCDAMELRENVCGACGWSAQAPRSEVTEVEEDPGGYPGAQGWVETVHGKIGRAGSTSAERFREVELVAGEVFESLALARESVPDGMTMERLLAELVVRQRPEQREESREFVRWWRDQLNGVLLLTEEVKAGG